MGCDCIDVDVDWCCAVELMADRIGVARREHKCDECRQIIRVGDKYRNEVYRSEDGVERHKTCTDCLSLRENIFCNFYYGCLWDDLENELYESGGQLDESCMAALTSKAREWVCEAIEKVWQELDDHS